VGLVVLRALKVVVHGGLLEGPEKVENGLKVRVCECSRGSIDGQKELK